MAAQAREAEPLSPRAVRDYALLVTLSVIWGSSFLLIKIAIAEVPPLTMTAARVVLALAILHALALKRGVAPPPPRDTGSRRLWGHFLVIGMLGNGIPFTLIAWGEIVVDSALAAILIGLMPMFTVVFAHASGVERIAGARGLLGVGAGFAGLVVLMGPAALAGLGAAALSELAVIAAAASYAATAVYARRLSLRVPALTLATGTMAASVIVMVPAALIAEAPWRLDPGMGALAAVAALGAIGTGAAALVYFRLLAAAGPTFTSMINYLIPVIGAALGVALLGESIGLAEGAALALILGGIALVRAR